MEDWHFNKVSFIQIGLDFKGSRKPRFFSASKMQNAVLYL